ncbi:hypothetical protein, partial [Crocosphaera watsonii]
WHLRSLNFGNLKSLHSKRFERLLPLVTATLVFPLEARLTYITPLRHSTINSYPINPKII